MYMSLMNLMFFFTLMMGMILSISAPSWFGAWIGLELNLMSFIPLIMNNKNQCSSESALKYFLIQALGSSLIIFAASLTLISYEFSMIMLTTPLLLKLGAAPFHFWFPQIMEGLSWPQSIILLTIQKIAPMFLLSYLTETQTTYMILMWASIFSALLGSIMGLNQTSLRKLMAFSSINHIGWLLMSLLISDSVFMLYFIFYYFMSTSVVLLFYFQQAFYMNQMMNQNNLPVNMKVIVFLSLLSLSGLPPFSGFFPKWVVIQELSMNKLYLPLVILIISALITLYFYLRVSISFFLLSSPKLKMSVKYTLSQSYFTPIFVFFNSLGLILPSILIFM
uniref:NADH dehydrogenase subunit 2 n=1 Tax=Blepharipoda liberata TaxID=1514702 RepID=UPI0021825842|nr:NADH dehydrogenase subunit 2 [Blepharipoda liberata]UVN15670.1 NADH dehydrogenase subunit 2 [Blepharipoda liberata]